MKIRKLSSDYKLQLSRRVGSKAKQIQSAYISKNYFSLRVKGKVPNATCPSFFEASENERDRNSFLPHINDLDFELSNKLIASPLLNEDIPKVADDIPPSNNQGNHHKISSISTQTEMASEPMQIDMNNTQEINVTKSIIGFEDNVQLQKLEKVASPTRFSESKLRIVQKALIKSYNIDIFQKEYTIKYFINSSLDILYIIVNADTEKYEMEYATNFDSSILDIINQKIHPCINIVSNQLILTESSINKVFTGLKIIKNTEISVRIDQYSPRSDVLITLQSDDKIISKKFEFFDIKDFFSNNGLEKEILLCCLYDDEGEIKIKKSIDKQLNLMYYKSHVFDSFVYYLKISEINFINSANYLIEAISKTSPEIMPLIIDLNSLSDITNIQISTLSESIEKVSLYITIKNSQIYLKNNQNNKASVSNNMPSLDTFKYKVSLKSPKITIQSSDKDKESPKIEQQSPIKKQQSPQKDQQFSQKDNQSPHLLEELKSHEKKPLAQTKTTNQDLARLASTNSEDINKSLIHFKALSTELPEKAAVKLQSFFRGYTARKNKEINSTKYSKKTIDNKEYLIKILDSKSTNRLYLIIKGDNKLIKKIFEYPLPFEQPYEVNIKNYLRIHKSELVLKIPGHKKYIYLEESLSLNNELHENSSISSGSDEYPEGINKDDLYDKVILRTCVKKNEKIFQISMSMIKSPADSDILVFVIRYGSSTENSQKFSIDIKTLCNKTGIKKKYLFLLGNYVIKNMLVLGQNDISYFDFTKGKINAAETVVKAQALIRGYITRKRIKLQKNKVVYKKKLMIDKIKYTVMLFRSDDKFSLKIVKGIEVISIELNVLFASGLFSDEDFHNFANKIIIPKIHIVKENGIYKIIGLEKYAKL